MQDHEREESYFSKFQFLMLLFFELLNTFMLVLLNVKCTSGSELHCSVKV